MTELQNRYDQAQSDVQTMENWYDTTKGANETLLRLIEDLEKVQPAAVSISHFSSQEGQVTIAGSSYGKPAAAEFIIQLKKLPYISDVKIEYLNEDIENYSAHDSFQMTFTLNYADPNEEQSEDESVESDIGVAEETEEPVEDSFEVEENANEELAEESQTDMTSEDDSVIEDDVATEGGVE